MYSVDDISKALALSPARHIYSRAIFGTFNGSTWENDRTYSDADSVISAQINIGTGSGGLVIGAAYCAKLTLNLMGDVTVNQTDRIVMRVGCYKADGTRAAAVSLGWFYVDTITRKGSTTTVVAYDKMLRGAKIYKPTSLTFPCSLSALLADVCDKMNVSLRDGVAPPYDAAITEAPIKGKDSEGNALYYTRREILGYIGSLMGGNWFFDAGGNLAFTQFAEISDIFAAANSMEADISSDAYSVTGISWNINGVSYSRNESENAAGILEFANPLSVGSKEPVMAAVEQRLVGLTYHGGTIKRQGCGWFELGDIVTAYDKNGTAYKVLITGISYSIANGAFTEKISSSALSDSESNYTSGDVAGQTVPQIVAQENTARYPVLKQYEVLSGTEIVYNGTTYTFTAGEGGEITEVTTDKGGSFTPTIPATLTDISAHNAAFMAVAMLSKLSSAPEPAGDIPDCVVRINLDDYTNPTKGMYILNNQAGTKDGAYSVNGGSIVDGGVAVPCTANNIGSGVFQLTAGTKQYTAYCVANGNAKTLRPLYVRASDKSVFPIAFLAYTISSWCWYVELDVYGVDRTIISTVPNTTKAVLCCKIDGTTATLYVNGIKIGTNTVPEMALPKNLQLMTGVDDRYGIYDNTPCTLYDAAICTSAHDDSTVAAVSTYLMQKYNITGG